MESLKRELHQLWSEMTGNNIKMITQTEHFRTTCILEGLNYISDKDIKGITPIQFCNQALDEFVSNNT